MNHEYEVHFWASLARHLWHYFSIFNLWFRPWRVALLLGHCGILPRPHPLVTCRLDFKYFTQKC